MKRENVYLVTCRSGSEVRQGHVRAWDEREAADVFVRELDDDGVQGAVDIRVQALRTEPVASAATP